MQSTSIINSSNSNSTTISSSRSENYHYSLTSLPASIFCFSLCQFLDSTDILNIRVTSWKIYQLLHEEPESKELWKLLLIRDFGFSNNNNNNNNNAIRHDDGDGNGGDDGEDDDTWWKFTLKVEFPIPNCHSIFGINPETECPLIEVKDAFESWKGWRRASSRFYEDLPNDNNNNNFNTEKTGLPLLIHAPYFLKAARIWEQLFYWCSRNYDTGQQILRSLMRGMRYKDWDANYRYKPGLKACQAVYAFCGGQTTPTFDGFTGLFGGYCAYGYYCNSTFVPPQHIGFDKPEC